jgi:hypothetical protein
MDPQIFRAILAMDSYNRGPTAHVKVSGDGVGFATVIPTFVQENQGNGFAAVAYNYAGGKIISYRGTDGIAADALHGFGIGAGNPRFPLR